MNITIYDGPPGVGKTTRIVNEAPALPGRTCVVTFTREAARTVRARGPSLVADTIYRLSWPLVRPFAVKGGRRQGTTDQAFQMRRIRSEFDPALDDYVVTAPSERSMGPADLLARALHGWPGPPAPPPFDLADPPARPTGSLAFALPLARWLAAGSPGLTDALRFDTVLIDEAQDMSNLELAVACALLAPGGHLKCYGDPGQALYAEPKGGREGASLPPAWTLPGSVHELMRGGHRVGEPLASTASRVLRPLWDRPAASFAAPHKTEVIEWWADGSQKFPPGAFVLGYSRRSGEKFVARWGIRDFALVPSMGGVGLTICTGHAAKGHQADDVFLLPWSDRPTGRSALDRLDEKQPAAIRLLYTMLTRARARVHVPPSLLARMQ